MLSDDLHVCNDVLKANGDKEPDWEEDDDHFRDDLSRSAANRVSREMSEDNIHP